MTGELPPAIRCPRCGSDRTVDYGAQIGCAHCGATWQADLDPMVARWRVWPGAVPLSGRR